MPLIMLLKEVHAQQSERKTFFGISPKNYVTGNTLFQSKVSVNVLQVEIYILKHVKYNYFICLHVMGNESCK